MRARAGGGGGGEGSEGQSKSAPHPTILPLLAFFFFFFLTRQAQKPFLKRGSARTELQENKLSEHFIEPPVDCKAKFSVVCKQFYALRIMQVTFKFEI